MFWLELNRHAWARRWVWLCFSDGTFLRCLPRIAWPGGLVYTSPCRPGAFAMTTRTQATADLETIMDFFPEGEACRLNAIFYGDADTTPVGDAIASVDDDDEPDDEDEDDEDEDDDGDVPAAS